MYACFPIYSSPMFIYFMAKCTNMSSGDRLHNLFQLLKQFKANMYVKHARWNCTVFLCKIKKKYERYNNLQTLLHCPKSMK